MAYTFAQYIFIKDEHGVKILDTLRHFILQFIEIQIQFLSIQSFIDTYEWLELWGDHNLFRLSTDANYSLYMLFVDHTNEYQVAIETVPSFYFHHRNKCPRIVVYSNIEKIA